MIPRVLILDDEIDIYDRVDKLIKITEQKTFKRDKLIINDISLTANNYDNYFSVNNSNSIFNNVRWRYKPFKIFNKDEEKIWDGIVYDIVRDHQRKLAVIRSRDRLYKFKNIKISYSSSDWETPAEAAKNIMDNYNFTDYNAKAVQNSINILTDAQCYIKCHINSEDNIKFMHALEKLGEYAVADVFTMNNEVYFKCWEPFVGGVTVRLTEDDILKSLKVHSPLEFNLINNYGITISDGTVETDAGNNNIGEVSRQDQFYGTQDLNEIDGSLENEIEIRDNASAVYIGETSIKRTHINLSKQPRPPEVIEFVLPIDFRHLITLETYFRISFSDEGWDAKLFEPYTIIKDEDNNRMTITAYEVQE